MRKYVLYAIGEIFLVVIGILIALQINNWNEQRKQSKQLNTAMQSIYKDLVADSVLIQNAKPSVDLRYRTAVALIKRSYATEVTLDSLINIMQNEFPVRWYSSPVYNTNTFSNLKATSTFDILPTDIKDQLSDYYTTLDEYRYRNENTLDQYRNHLDEFVKKYNIIGRLYDPNYQNSYIYNSTWENIDEKDFTPRVAVLMAAYKVLFENAQNELDTNLENIRSVLPKLAPYVAR